MGPVIARDPEGVNGPRCLRYTISLQTREHTMLSDTTIPPAAPGGDIDLSIVIPAYNEAAGIADTLQAITEYLEGQAYRSEVIVVDDGSTDATASILTGYKATRPSLRVLHNRPNLGKGASVRRGVLEARGRYVFFMDADLSVPVNELTGAFAAMSAGDEPILIGSRKAKGARIERRQPLLREYLGHGFTYLARLLLWPAILDFTCGFKGFRRDTARMLFRLQQRDDWAFDAEILYLARLMGAGVRQYPIHWKHGKTSRVRFPRDIYRTLGALIRIRWQVSRMMRKKLLTSTVLSSRAAGD